MPYHIYLFERTEKGNKTVAKLEGEYSSQEEAAMLIMEKNKERGVDLSTLKTGDLFYMYRGSVTL